MTANPTEPKTESEFDRIAPETKIVQLSGDVSVEILPLKTRQFFKLARIITHGGMNVLDSFLKNAGSPDDDGFAEQLVALVLFAIPEAGDEAIEFIQSMCAPTGLTGDTKKDRERWKEYSLVMSNPSLDDTLTILEVILRTEGPELRALGNRLAVAVKSMSSLQDKNEPTPQPETTQPEIEVISPSQESSEPSVELTT